MILSINGTVINTDHIIVMPPVAPARRVLGRFTLTIVMVGPRELVFYSKSKYMLENAHQRIAAHCAKQQNIPKIEFDQS